MEEAKKHRLDAEALSDEYKSKLGDIESQGQEIIQKSRQKANEESEKILKQSRDTAKEMITDAETRIAQEQEQALMDAQLDITGLATEMAARILEREVSGHDNVNIVDEFFKK